jgi:hypothetical protein
MKFSHHMFCHCMVDFIVLSLDDTCISTPNLNDTHSEKPVVVCRLKWSSTFLPQIQNQALELSCINPKIQGVHFGSNEVSIASSSGIN